MMDEMKFKGTVASFADYVQYTTWGSRWQKSLSFRSGPF